MHPNQTKTIHEKANNDHFFFGLLLLFLLGVSAGTPSQAITTDSLRQALQQSTRLDKKLDLTKSLLKQYVKARQYDSAVHYAMLFKSFALKEGSNTNIGKAWYNLGIVYWLKNLPDSSNLYFAKAVPRLARTPDTLLLSKCLTKMGTNFLRTSDFDKALAHYRKSYRLRETLKDTVLMANNLINIAGCHYQVADYDLAIRNYHKALDLAERSGNAKLEAYCYNNIGNIYMKMENFQQAITYLQQALEVNRKIGNHAEAARNLLNLGSAYEQSGQQEKAVETLEASLSLRQELKNADNLSETYTSLGSIYLKLDKKQQALTYYNRALEAMNHSGDRFARASLLSQIGLLQMEAGNPLGESNLLQSLELAEEIHARQLMIADLDGLIDYYSRSGNFEQATLWYRQRSELSDSIYSESTANALAEMQTRYETEKKAKENELLLKENLLQKGRLKLTIVFISGLLLLLVVVAYLFRVKSKSLKQSKLLYTQEKELNKLALANKEIEKEHLEDKIFAEKQLNRLQREKYETELARKNEKLANSALCILNKNEVLSNLKQEILSGTKDKEKEDFIPEIVRMINNNIDLDQNWQKFSINFEEVHPGFFDSLSQKHPGLSEVYIKLAAYIRISLTTSEIAQLLNVTVAAVKKSRQRLRKKLDLAHESSLVEYLSQL